MPTVQGYKPMLGQQTMMPQQMAPQTGLMGSEAALQQGLGGSIDALMAGAMQGRQDLQSGMDIANLANAAAHRRLQRGTAAGMSALGQAGNQVGSAIGQGVDALNPYNQSGQAALGQQSALAGLDGQAAFNSALMNNPATQFLQQQGEQATLRNARALGYGGGGNVMKELSRFNTGLAAQDLQNQFNRVNAITGQGFQAGGQIGQLKGQEAGIRSALGQAGAQLQGNAAMQASNIAQNNASRQMQFGQNMSNAAIGTGQNIGQAILGTGQNLAAGRTRAGEQIAGNVQGTTSSLANLINQQGGGLADIIGSGASASAGAISDLANQLGMSSEQLAAMLSNQQMGQASQVAGLPGVSYTPSNTLAQVGQLTGGIGTMLGAINQGGAQVPAQNYVPPAATINTGAQYGGYA